jgi:hypothetical protein
MQVQLRLLFPDLWERVSAESFKAFAQLPRCGVQSGIKIDKLMRPNLLADFFPGDNITQALQQQCQASKGLELTFAKINLEGSKASKPVCGSDLLQRHGLA